MAQPPPFPPLFRAPPPPRGFSAGPTPPPAPRSFSPTRPTLPPPIARPTPPPPPSCSFSPAMPTPPPPHGFLPAGPTPPPPRGFPPAGPTPPPFLLFPGPPPPPFAPGPPRWTPPSEAPSPPEASEEDPEHWLVRLLGRRRPPVSLPPVPSLAQAGLLAAEALRLVAPLARQCAAWRDGNEGGEEEAGALLGALRVLLRPLLGGTPARRLARAGRSRRKRLRRRQEARAAREQEEARRAEVEVRVDRWRAQRTHEVEEKRREQEFKATADKVLSEVRKKQSDTKQMAEILRGLEKLRKLRKEAAGRKGVFPPPGADEDFENKIQSLRTSIKERTELYEAEERALQVMLEGEQEEERKRETEKKQKKEKEKLLKQRHEMEAELFGDPEEFPLNHLLEPYRRFYLQAEYSVPALIQIRHEWDQYLVPADHPEGSFIPPGWVLPSPPSSDIWATAVG